MDDPYINNTTERNMNEQTRKALELAREALKEVDAPKAWPFAVKQDRREAIAAIDAALSAPAAPVAQPLVESVINAARAAMDESTEAYDADMSIKIPSHLAASLSLCLDEYDRAHGIVQGGA